MSPGARATTIACILAAPVLLGACKKFRRASPAHLVDQIALGDAHTCAKMRDGSLQCWGNNADGQLGDSPGGGRERPASLADGGPFAQISARGARTCAVGSSNIRCWGRGVLPVVGVAGALEVAVGAEHACARLATGEATCWGANARGQLGDGTTIPRQTPGASVIGLKDVLQIAAGDAHTCARLGDGTVRCWGENDAGQLGDGSRVNHTVPAAVKGLRNVTRIAAGGAHTCARIGTESVVCWGKNDEGQLGDGTTTDRTEPALVLGGITGAVQLALGAKTTCARMQDASLFCWGSNAHHELGDSTTVSKKTPALVFGVFDVVEVGAGAQHVCARMKDATMRCWGDNASGQIGDGTRATRPVPVTVVFH